MCGSFFHVHLACHTYHIFSLTGVAGSYSVASYILAHFRKYFLFVGLQCNSLFVVLMHSYLFLTFVDYCHSMTVDTGHSYCTIAVEWCYQGWYL